MSLKVCTLFAILTAGFSRGERGTGNFLTSLIIMHFSRKIVYNEILLPSSKRKKEEQKKVEF
jgi:hypothetical protein